jgi:hypothetical protein
MHPDGHSDITRDQVSKKKKEQKALFFLAGVVSNETRFQMTNFFCRTAPPAHLGLHQGSNFGLAGVSRFLVFPERAHIVFWHSQASSIPVAGKNRPDPLSANNHFGSPAW